MAFGGDLSSRGRLSAAEAIALDIEPVKDYICANVGAVTTSPNTCVEIFVQGRQDMHLECLNPGFGSADLSVAGPRFFV